MATGGQTTRQRSYYKASAASVTAWTVGRSTFYEGLLKPDSTYGHNRNWAETTLAKTETEPKVILEAVSATQQNSGLLTRHLD